MDKESFTATYAYDGGRIDTGSTNFLKAYTTAYTGWTMKWESFRVDNASLYLREENPRTCTAEVKMSFAAAATMRMSSAAATCCQSFWSAKHKTSTRYSEPTAIPASPMIVGTAQ